MLKPTVWYKKSLKKSKELRVNERKADGVQTTFFSRDASLTRFRFRTNFVLVTKFNNLMRTNPNFFFNPSTVHWQMFCCFVVKTKGSFKKDGE